MGQRVSEKTPQCPVLEDDWAEVTAPPARWRCWTWGHEAAWAQEWAKCHQKNLDFLQKWLQKHVDTWTLCPEWKIWLRITLKEYLCVGNAVLSICRTIRVVGRIPALLLVGCPASFDLRIPCSRGWAAAHREFSRRALVSGLISPSDSLAFPLGLKQPGPSDIHCCLKNPTRYLALLVENKKFMA